MEKKQIYLASPFGFSEAGREFMYGVMVPKIKEIGLEVIDPWKLTDSRLFEEALEMPYGLEQRLVLGELNMVAGRNNVQAIERSDGIIAVLDGTDIDSGTASEIGYGAALRKRTLGYRGDFRLSADNYGARVNLQVEHFIKMNGGFIISSIDHLQHEAKRLFLD